MVQRNSGCKRIIMGITFPNRTHGPFVKNLFCAILKVTRNCTIQIFRQMQICHTWICMYIFNLTIILLTRLFKMMLSVVRNNSKEKKKKLKHLSTICKKKFIFDIFYSFFKWKSKTKLLSFKKKQIESNLLLNKFC